MNHDTTRLLPAAALLMVTMVLFTLLDTTAKHLAESLPVPIIVWVRYSVHCLLMLLVLGPRMGRALVTTSRPLLNVVRGLMLLLTTGFGIAALSTLPLAETLAIAFLSPLFVVLAARPFLGERPSPATWVAVVLGFCGVLLIVRPGGAVAGAGIAFALGAAVVYSIYQLLTRSLSGADSPVTLLFYTALVGSLGASLVAPFFWPQHPITAHQWLLLASLGLYGGGGHFLLIRAFGMAPASSLSPLLYIQLIWQTLAGYLVFDHMPDPFALAGGCFIVGSGLIVVWSQRKPSPKDAR